jgi:transposase
VRFDICIVAAPSEAAGTVVSGVWRYPSRQFTCFEDLSSGSCEEIGRRIKIATVVEMVQPLDCKREPSPALPRLASIDRSQLILRTVDVEKLIDEDHSARSIWELVGRMDLSLYYAEIAAVEGSAGRNHTSPRLLISLWLYAYGRGISSARELSRQCEFEPGSLWLCGCQPISYRTLSGFRSDHQVALDDLFVQVLGMLGV